MEWHATGSMFIEHCSCWYWSSRFQYSRTEKRLETSKKFGATISLNRHIMSVEEIKKVVINLTQGRGVDYAIEAVGKPSVTKEGLQLVRNGRVYLS